MMEQEIKCPKCKFIGIWDDFEVLGAKNYDFVFCPECGSQFDMAKNQVKKPTGTLPPDATLFGATK